jgi:LacI family transcriptional regulator
MAKQNGAKRSHRLVGVLVETDDTWGRNIVEAVCRFAQGAEWSLLISPRDSQGRARLPRVWNGDGIITALRNPAMVKHVKGLKLPTVDVSTITRREDSFARVATDDQARASLALQHLRSRGLESFACYAPPIGRYSDLRSQAFAQAVEQAGFPCAMYLENEGGGWLDNYTRARQWLRKLPRPLGVFAADPYPARQLVEICATDGIRVPDEVAVISGDDDELLCKVASPQISSVELASHEIGRTAGRLLQRMMNGAAVPRSPRLVPPRQVRARQSTDLLAVAAPDLAAILKEIHQHAHRGITVADLLNQFPMSRRSLEYKFRASIQRSPAEEIRRVRFEHIRRLLLDTDKTIETIALESGFSSGPALSAAFRNYFQHTPGSLRNPSLAD